MSSRLRAPVALAGALVLATGILPPSARAADPGLVPIASPARGASHEPNLCALPDGRIGMSWLEARVPSGLSLRFATFDGKRWTAPYSIAEGDSFFANWADFPSVRALPGGALVAHWLWKSGAGTYAYDVRISRSEDGGRTWSTPVTPHRDGTATEHGFVSLVPADAGVMAIWLDGRNGEGHPDTAATSPDMTLRAAVVTRNGTIEQEALVDGRTCDCCQTAAVLTDRGALVAYRDRGPTEIRDIFLSRFEGGRWSEPVRLHADEWHINGCPVNGPALDARGSHVVVAWFSGAEGEGTVRAAISRDGGLSFGDPVRIDEGHPLGRVHVAMQDDRRALVTWMEGAGKTAHIRGRYVSANGEPGPSRTFVEVSLARSSGFPRVVRTPRMCLLAWTESGKERRVRVARLD